MKSVVTCDLEGRIQTYNQGAEEIFGYRPDEVIGKKGGNNVVSMLVNDLKD